MCGIAGFAGQGSDATIRKMTDALRHRGPDAEGFFYDEKTQLHLGHRRLSIIDLADGTQPMLSADKRFAVVFNGEIYNHAELRNELQAAGHRFASDHSDTEVLLHGYAKWGANLQDRLNGMWAFVIYDVEKKQLFGSRDRFGKKPFFYFQNQGTFAFASELTALLEHPSSPRSLSTIGLQKFFAYSLIPAPHSIIEGIRKLPAGHCFHFDLQSHSLKLQPWWEYRLEPDDELSGRSEEFLAEEFRERLKNAVARRLVADVPLGVFLSGGIDSTAVTALAADIRSADKVSTFSIGFDEASFDESAYAQAAAESIGTKHHCEKLSLSDSRRLLPSLLQRIDEPQGDNSLLPTWLLCKSARKHVTVALGGDGGDELLAGYDPFKALTSARKYHRTMPRGIHPALRKLANFLPVSHRNMSLDFKVKRMLRGLSYAPSCWLPAWMGALEPSEINDYFGSSLSAEELYSEAIAAWESPSATNDIDRATQYFIKIYLQDGILAKVDRASMLNSLEVRAPFLDIELVDFIRKLPPHFKYRNGRGKLLLRTALRGSVPDTVLERKKKGFGSPMGAWFRQGLASQAADETNAFAKKRQTAHRAGKQDERLFLWAQYALDEWKAGHKKASIVPKSQ
ncbi:MAG: asparagine synthase (glutamine-hydrolyzing) [Chthoniobacterales bacterium]